MSTTPTLYLSHGAPPLADDDRWTRELSDWSAQLTATPRQAPHHPHGLGPLGGRAHVGLRDQRQRATRL
ncbi:MAG: hypothetical protein ABR616_14175 [Dermatophilaceae bacterium]